MSACGVALLTYLWHYLVARLLYDELVHPLVRGDLAALVAVAAAAGLAVALAGHKRRRAR
jgi:hypothetical protein